MANYDIRPLQLHIQKILLAVDQVCKEHHLRYYLWAGTMLGAVRHKGFIPWDDDMDICMPRPDYELLVKHCQQWLPKPFEMTCAENTENYPGAFAKIIDGSTTLIEREFYGQCGGLYIDVFPIDGVPEGELAQRWVMGQYNFYKKISYYLHRDPYKHGKGPRSWIPLLCRRLFNPVSVLQKMKRLLIAHDYEKCNLVADYDDGYRGIIDKNVLGNPTPIQFEDNTFWGVEHYHEYLSTKYGDYMTIPDGDHQRQHNFFYLDYNLPYKEYERLHRGLHH